MFLLCFELSIEVEQKLGITMRTLLREKEVLIEDAESCPKDFLFLKNNDPAHKSHFFCKQFVTEGLKYSETLLIH